jgi:FG-GAP-like repeat/FG-GAP repeat
MTKLRNFILLLVVMLNLLCAPTLAQTCSVPSFTQPPVYPVGSDVRSVATADFDGDGRPDLAVANVDASTVTVVLKAGQGKPAIIDNYAVGTFPLSVATGDFTGDGKTDIISASTANNTISLLRNNGSGAFVAAGTFNSGSGPVDLAAGDFNNNGTLDVAVAAGSGVNILMGNGQGGFSAPTFLQVFANKVIVADFNNDGKLDLATSTQIRLGNGAGQFPTGGCAPPSSSGGFAAGDVNGDGKLDLVGASILAGQIQIQLLNGSACLGTPTNIDVLNFGRPGFVALGDLNKDGKLDIVAGTTVLLNTGSGAFGPPVAYGMGSLGADPGANTVIADFNGDSNLDIASASTGQAGILFGDGIGGFRNAVGPNGRGAFGLAQADLNNDGKQDVVAMSNGGFAVMLGDGTGNLSTPANVTVPSASSFVGPVIADFNSDNKLDVVVVDATHNGPGGLSRFQVAFGDGLGGFGSIVSTSFDAVDPFAVSGGDLNADGKIDLVTVNRGGGTINNEAAISIALSDGTGHFTIQPNASVRTASNPIGVAFADFNKDGKMDIAVPSGFGFSILLGNGAGGFAPRIHSTTANSSSIRAADFNGDGNVDLAMVDEGFNGKTSVVLGDGTGGFTAPLQFTLGSFHSDLTVADFNNDGKLDLAVSISRQEPFPPNPPRSNIAVLLGDGAGGFGPPFMMLTERNASRIISFDLNGDARPDIVTANQLVNNLSVALNTCGAPPLFTISGVVKNGNGQGIPDVAMILTSDVTAPQIVLTQGNGSYVFTYAGNLSHNLRVTPAKAGFSFSPLAIVFTSTSSVTGDQTASFTGTPSSTPPAGQIPILLTREDSQRALALDSVTFTSEPFAITNDHNFSADQRTRVILFAVNVELGTGETTSVIEAQAEDSGGQIFPLTVEHFSSVPNFGWLKQIIVKLPAEVANSGEIHISLKVRGTTGNTVTLKVTP